MKKLFILSLLCFSFLLSSCGGGGGEDTTVPDNQTGETTESDTAAGPADITVAKDKETDYTVIYSQDDSESADAAARAWKLFRTELGVFFELETDDKKEVSGKEIVIGKTDREAYSRAKKELRKKDFGIYEENGSIVIYGASEEYLDYAVNCFIDKIKSEQSKGDIVLEKGYEYSEIAKNAGAVEWNGLSLPVSNGGYPRICEDKDGSLICVYSKGAWVCMARSTDGGNTWAEAKIVAPSGKAPNGLNIEFGNGNLFVLEDGSYICGYRAHNPKDDIKNSFYSSIRYVVSKDQGKTWSEEHIVVENTHKGKEFTGFWEPHFIYIDGGKLAMYYASDCIGGDAENYPFVKSMSYQHIILHIYDEEKGEFGEPIIASDGEKHNSRDGMPVVSKMADGNYVMVIEANREKDKYPFYIMMLMSDDGINWSEPKLIVCPPIVNNYAGAPYVCLLSDGRLAVSCMGTAYSGIKGETSTQSSLMNVYISKKPLTYEDRDSLSTDTFEKVLANPFPTNGGVYNCWPSMLEYQGKLLCAAQCSSKGGDDPSLLGVFIRVGIIKESK